jgi:hypothetical protein
VQISVKVSVTIERLERAIAVTAYCMTKHNLPQLMPALKRLEAERDNLIANGDPIQYAERILKRHDLLEERRSLAA